MSISLHTSPAVPRARHGLIGLLACALWPLVATLAYADAVTDWNLTAVRAAAKSSFERVRSGAIEEEPAMKKPTTSETGRKMGRPKVNPTSYTIGIDLGDKFSHYCVLNPEAEVIEAGRVKATREALSARFATIPPMCVAS
jgi:hypothetical protein